MHRSSEESLGDVISRIYVVYFDTQSPFERRQTEFGKAHGQALKERHFWKIGYDDTETVESGAGSEALSATDVADGRWRLTFSPKRLQNVMGAVDFVPVRSSKI
jgi:hypothetical protein